MLLKLNLSLFFAFFAFNAKTAKAVQSCIGSLAELAALQDARWNNTATPVTYVMCPNTVYPIDQFIQLNGNASYLCGANGVSANHCIFRGGYAQLGISLFSYGDSSKDNILVSGFTFEKSTSVNVAIGVNGRSIFRDCIFKVSCICLLMMWRTSIL
jgi:hypothetical protein